MTHGDPVAAGVLPARRPRGGARLAEVADVFMDDDEDAEEDGWEHALLIGSSRQHLHASLCERYRSAAKVAEGS